MVKFWELNQDGHSCELSLNMDYNWVINIDGKDVLVYNQDMKRWIGVYQGHLIKIDWPSFRDIMIQYLKMIDGKVDSV
jgi:hypothetical protein